jgi:hypothetical protein
MIKVLGSLFALAVLCVAVWIVEAHGYWAIAFTVLACMLQVGVNEYTERMR